MYICNSAEIGLVQISKPVIPQKLAQSKYVNMQFPWNLSLSKCVLYVLGLGQRITIVMMIDDECRHGGCDDMMCIEKHCKVGVVLKVVLRPSQEDST